LSKAVKKQMVADVEVGAFLSGGLDSTGLVYFARENSCAGRPQCFTIEIEGQDRSNDGFSLDLPYAQHVSRKFELPLHIVKIPAESLFDIDKMVYHLDEPSYDPAALNAYYICGHAREVGVKILLSGAGGDDIFTGYRRHLALQMERYWTWLPQSSRALLRRGVESLPQQYAFTRRAAKNFRYADGNDINRLLGYYHWLPSDRLLDIFSPKIISALESRGDEDTFRRSLAWASPDISRLNQMLYLDTKYFLTEHNLNYTDKMSMAHGVEVRVPYLDPAVISFAARLPDHFKQNGVTGKWILREALRPYIPPMILDRPKSGFGAPLRKWFDGPLKPLFNDMLSEQAIQRRGIFDARGVRKLIRDVETGQVDGVYSLFGIACMEAWFRRFVDKVTR
jgi:asparagine synthase (glutamine-hydrolysing)